VPAVAVVVGKVCHFPQASTLDIDFSVSFLYVKGLIGMTMGLSGFTFG
jgi:hypothetical protein